MSYKGTGGGDNHERLSLARLSQTRINTPHMGEIVCAVCVYVCVPLLCSACLFSWADQVFICRKFRPTGPHVSRASHDCLAWRPLACSSQGFARLLLSEQRNVIVLMSSIKRFKREKQPADTMTRRSTRI